jgi:Ser/Thr protein kinase RdoA (MazF antagonist)
MATRSSLSAPPAGLAPALTERYGFRRVEVRGRLAGGYTNDLFVVQADGDAVVARVQRRPVDVESLAWEHRLVRLLAERVPEVVTPLAAADGSTFFRHGDDTVALLPYVEGAPAEPGRDASAAAAAIGRFHGASARLDLQPRPGSTPLDELRSGIESGRYFAAIGPHARELPPPLAARREEIDRALGWALAFTEGVQRATTHAIHSDIFRGNVLLRGGRVVALLDWEEAHVDWAAVDLADGMWDFCRPDGAIFDPDAGPGFVRAYRAAGGTVPPDEDDLLLPLVRVRRILELVRAPYDYYVDWEYQAANLEEFDRLG